MLTSFGQVIEEDFSSNIKNAQTKKLKKHPKLTIKIDSLEIGKNKFEVNFQYSGKIKTQTGLMKINDSIAINVIFLRLRILNQDEFLYSYTFYRKENKDIWEAVSAIQFYNLKPGSYTDGWGGIGYRGDSNCFWYKMYCKFE
jgi:hypothetical protein